jgi:glycosyltransferase involved in cell wall biosynthesis
MEIDSQRDPGTQGSSGPTALWPAGVGFVYMGISPWAGMWKNRHQLMSRFAARLPVMYVEPWQRLRRLRRLRRSRPGLSELMADFRMPLVDVHESGVKVFRSPLHLPVSGSSRARRATLGAWLRRVRRAAAECGIQTPVLWVSHPEMADVVGTMGEALAVYHIVDDYAGYTGAGDVANLTRREQALLDRVDLSIAVTPELIAAREGPGRRLELVENAVDYDAFRLAAERREEPPGMAGIPRPRVGYSGLIGVRLDMELLLHLARRSPGSSFVFIGKVDPRGCETDLEALRALPNVYFLGEQPAAAVPDHVAAFDVGLLPYAINRETLHISPLKLYEYLAAGKPVIATPIPAAQRNEDRLSLARNADEFALALEASLGEDASRVREERYAFAAENTWAHRVQQIDDLLHPMVAESIERAAAGMAGR